MIICAHGHISPSWISVSQTCSNSDLSPHQLCVNRITIISVTNGKPQPHLHFFTSFSPCICICWSGPRDSCSAIFSCLFSFLSHPTDVLLAQTHVISQPNICSCLWIGLPASCISHSQPTIYSRFRNMLLNDSSDNHPTSSQKPLVLL